MESIEREKEKEIQHPFDMRVEFRQVFHQHAEDFGREKVGIYLLWW